MLAYALLQLLIFFNFRIVIVVHAANLLFLLEACLLRRLSILNQSRAKDVNTDLKNLPSLFALLFVVIIEELAAFRSTAPVLFDVTDLDV